MQCTAAEPLGCIARCISRGILSQEAKPAVAVSDDCTNITQHALHERKLANTRHAYVSQHDLRAWHDVGNAMHKLFASVNICVSAIRHSMKKAALVPKPRSRRKRYRSANQNRIACDPKDSQNINTNKCALLQSCCFKIG